MKGLRQFGKNFFKIRKELLPLKETAELVEFYYLWKKTPQAASSRFHRRHRRQTVLRKIRNAPPATGANASKTQNTCLPRSATPSDPNDLTSVSEDEDSDDSDSRDLSGYSCSHCATATSKDWHHAGKDRLMMCTDCRLFLNKTGQMRPLNVPTSEPATPTKTEPPPPLQVQPNGPAPTTTPTASLPFLFKPVKQEDSETPALTAANGKHVMRTRRSKDSTKGSKTSHKSESVSPDRNDVKNGTKSPVDCKIITTHQNSSKRPSSTSGPSSPKSKKRKDASEKDSGENEGSSLDDKAELLKPSDAASPDSVTTENSSAELPAEETDAHVTNGTTEDACKKSVEDEEEDYDQDAVTIKNEDEKIITGSPAPDMQVAGSMLDSEYILAKKEPSETEVSSGADVPSPPPSSESEWKESVPPIVSAPLITPKLEPTASPPPPKAYSISSLSSVPSEKSDSNNHSLPDGAPMDQHPPPHVPLFHPHLGPPGLPPHLLHLQPPPGLSGSSRSSASPVRIKEERPMFSSSSSPPIRSSSGHHPSMAVSRNSSSPDLMARHSFPFGRSMHGPSPNSNQRGLASPHSFRDMRGDDRSEHRDSRSSDSTPRSKTPKGEKSSAENTPSSSSPRPPQHILNPFGVGSPYGPPGMSPIMTMPSRADLFMHPAYTMAPSGLPVEQRLQAMGHPAFGPQGMMGPHPSQLGPAAFGFPFGAPGMPPYFTPPWFAAPRPPGIPFPSPVPSPTRENQSNKSKSPTRERRESGHEKSDRRSDDRRSSDLHHREQEEEEPEQQSMISRGPSPEPKIEDSECHRSQSAMYAICRSL